MLGMVEELRKMNVREVLHQGINLALIVTSALMLWKGLVVFTGSESPIVVVLTGSMEPGFWRGDILFLYNPNTPMHTSDVVVYNIDKREIPIVHRTIKVHEQHDGDFLFLTKGDNNEGDDYRGGLYAPGQKWLTRSSILGRVVGYLPAVGYVTIVMNDYPMLKYGLLGALGLYVMVSKDG